MTAAVRGLPAAEEMESSTVRFGGIGQKKMSLLSGFIFVCCCDHCVRVFVNDLIQVGLYCGVF